MSITITLTHIITTVSAIHMSINIIVIITSVIINSDISFSFTYIIITTTLIIIIILFNVKFLNYVNAGMFIPLILRRVGMLTLGLELIGLKFFLLFLVI